MEDEELFNAKEEVHVPLKRGWFEENRQVFMKYAKRYGVTLLVLCPLLLLLLPGPFASSDPHIIGSSDVMLFIFVFVELPIVLFVWIVWNRKTKQRKLWSSIVKADFNKRRKSQRLITFIEQNHIWQGKMATWCLILFAVSITWQLLDGVSFGGVLLTIGILVLFFLFYFRLAL